MTLVAESTTSVLHCSEAVSQPGVSPEDIALQAAQSLLVEIRRGGCVDRKHQTLVLMMMVLGSEDVGRCLMSEPTARTSVNLISLPSVQVRQSLLTHSKLQNSIPSGCQGRLLDVVQNRSHQVVGSNFVGAHLLVLWDWLHQH